MTCAHVLDLIDAGPFADYPRMHLDAAWQHARQCATCGPALNAATALTTELAVLPQHAPPPDLAMSVRARIAQIEQGHSASAAAAMAEKRAAFSTRDWSAWVTTFGGLTAGLAFVLSVPAGERAAIDIASFGFGRRITGPSAMSPTTTGAVALAAGLVLYVGGLFAPLGGRNGRF